MLLPVSTYERAPVGLFFIKDATTVEGGNVGKIEAGAAAQLGKVVVNKANGQDTSTAMLGLIDESSTGSKYSGLGNTGMFGTLVPSVGAKTTVGPSSTFGSGKCTIWTTSGIFVTDQYNTTEITENTAVGTALYASAAGVLQTTQVGSGAVVGNVIKVFEGGIDSTLNAITDAELYGVLPRIQSLPTGTKLLLFKFK